MYGLVLEGGGARGAYHIGAYKALLELDIIINGVSGTSIGALNGAAIVQGEYDKLVEIWKKIDLESLFGFNKSELQKLKKGNITEDGLSYILNLSKSIISNRGLDTAKIRKLVENFISEDKVRKSKLDFGMVTISLTDKQPVEVLKEEIPKGKLIDYIMASANLPVFKTEKFDGKIYLDGGVYDNLPFSVLMKKGYKDFIAVRTHAFGRIRKLNRDDINIIYVQPVDDLGGVLEFDGTRAEYNMLLGYYDTIKVFKKLKGHKYYIKPYKRNFLKYIIEEFEEKKIRVKNVASILGYDDIPYDRLVFEKIFPRLASILEMKDKYDYEDVILKLVEHVAEKYEDIERFKIYDSIDFIKKAINKFRQNPYEINKKIPSIFTQNKILSLAVRDELLTVLFKEMFV